LSLQPRLEERRGRRRREDLQTKPNQIFKTLTKPNQIFKTLTKPNQIFKTLIKPHQTRFSKH